MADNIVPILLNQGLDTVTPAPMVEPGTMIDCLNYEMTGTAGYRRIDGYERTDGWIGGGISDYYSVNVTINDAGVVASLVAGATLINVGNEYTYGVVVSYTGNAISGVLVYIPTNKDLPLIPESATMAVYPTTTTQLTASSTATKGSTTDDIDTFLTNIRSYSSTLRGLVTDIATPIAGLHWFRGNLIVAADTYVIEVQKDLGVSVETGQLLDYGTTRYRVIKSILDSTSTPNTYTLYLQPVATTTNTTTIKVVNRVDGTLSQLTTNTPTITATNTDYAALFYAESPETSYARGFTPIHSTFLCRFTGGKQISGADPQAGDAVYVQYNGAGTDFANARIISVSVTNGSFAANNAEGFVELQMRNASFTTMPRTYVTTSDVVYGDSGLVTAAFSDITEVQYLQLAGTAKLRIANTRYEGATYNFYGDDDRTEGYLVTGVSAGAWVRIPQVQLTYSDATNNLDYALTSNYSGTTCGVLWTNTTSTNERPKYVAVHNGTRLALGYARGSVILSVVGEPHNFSGLEGATELAPGDNITGLIEAPGDSLIIFGKRSIRRVTGSTDADMAVQTIDGGSGCFDYTARLVGSTPMFVGPNGISSLDQAQEYGDFVGTRMSYKITTTLLDEIVPDRGNSELGGVAMALPVRNKNQYRVWLGTGKVVSVCFTADGPKITTINYGGTSDNRVPFAWTSQLTDYGQEVICVVWDKVRAQRYLSITGTSSSIPSETRIYRLERGWGFDGATFDHYFDLAHVFPTNGVQSTTVDKVRLFGLSHGIATLNVKTAGIEDDFDQSYHTTIQDISLPATASTFYPNMKQVTSIIDQANWGLGIKIRIANTTASGSSSTEPSHICQVMNLFVRTEGAIDG